MIERPRIPKERMFNNFRAKVFGDISGCVLHEGWIKDIQELQPQHISLPYLWTDSIAVQVFQETGLLDMLSVVSIGEDGYRIRSVSVWGESRKKLFSKGKTNALQIGISGFRGSELAKVNRSAIELKYEEGSKPPFFRTKGRKVLLGEFSQDTESVLLLNAAKKGIKVASVILSKNWREAFGEKRIL